MGRMEKQLPKFPIVSAVAKEQSEYEMKSSDEVHAMCVHFVKKLYDNYLKDLKNISKKDRLLYRAIIDVPLKSELRSLFKVYELNGVNFKDFVLKVAQEDVVSLKTNREKQEAMKVIFIKHWGSVEGAFEMFHNRIVEDCPKPTR